MHIDLVNQPGFLLIIASCLPSGEGVDFVCGGYRYHFWTFQLELNRIGSKNFANGSIVAKFQTLKVGEILEIFDKFKPKSNGNPSNVFRQRLEGPEREPRKKCRPGLRNFFHLSRRNQIILYLIPSNKIIFPIPRNQDFL